MEITSLAVELLANTFAAEKRAMQASKMDTIDILLIIFYNKGEGTRAFALSPQRLFLPVMYGDCRCDNCQNRGNHRTDGRNPLMSPHCLTSFP